ncbi:MAG: c-type cytochrome biogenesis protein CcsB [Desulfobacterales bacterium]|nr:c-type cytochrome biogenesis protein CcsB [Desulfobacterales bacterium]MCP4159187.1 c-type cytochrome biogenesis protein CcsB [Deltaproteobacteria bacterium]
MSSSLVLSIVIYVYGFAFIFYTSSAIFSKKEITKVGTILSYIALSGNILGFALRWIESYDKGYGHIPLSNLYESLVFFALVIAILYLYLEYRHKKYIISIICSLFCLICMLYASFQTADAIRPLLPALKSNWLTIHVLTCFLGYSGFAVAFALSVLLIMKNALPEKIVKFTEAEIDDLTHQMVSFGFIFLTLGIITGAVWANSAWGSYWTWDPKENWSLITWFVYLAFLHLRFMKGWHGRRLAIVSIIGFLAVMFTYFGVNYLPGLHSYGN